MAGPAVAVGAGEAAAATAANHRVPPVPLYPVRLPPPRVLAYDLSRGFFTGTGELDWRPSGDRYRARLEGRIAGLNILQWTSEGQLDRSGLAPDRFTDRRRGGRELAARFDRQDGLVRYLGAAPPLQPQPLPPGAQDRLSWMVQIAAVAQARARPLEAGDRISLWVTGARGDAQVWDFQCRGLDTRPVAGRSVKTTHLVREPRDDRHARVDVWLDPERDHLPVKARLGTAQGDDPLELALRA